MGKAVAPELRAQGVAVLLAYWGRIFPPKSDRAGVLKPGIRCEGYGDVRVTAVGYSTPEDASKALQGAARVLLDAGLVVGLGLPGVFVVRRKEVV